jgi:predicted nuclease of predicted toxin-antitoxin system
MDVHVPQPITDQLRRRSVEVLTAIDDGWAERDDDELLEHARALGRLIFTQDIRFRALAEDWQRRGRPFSGLGLTGDPHLFFVRLGNAAQSG